DQKLRPIANFKRLGLLSDRLICVHMTQLNDQEIQDIAEAKSHVVHCPTSDLKLAGGVCRVSELLKAGVNVAIGTEGGFCNKLDMFAEMKLAAILAKVQSMESTSVPAAMALQMATLNGAKAIGLEKEIGSIEVGKRADLVAVACDNIEMLPMYNAISHVVYVAGRENVSDVWINGKQVLADRQLTTI
ncbi:5-methylthioadenosine/s-adenosylhomocysteine deaminase, partial [Globisporangium polare]